MTTTLYFDDFLLYYEKAKILQDRNLGFLPPDTKVNDPLMDNITIYDCVERRVAGFSNMLQQLWYGSQNPKKHQINTNFDVLRHGWSLDTWLYVFLTHRMTGSGASFEHDHGFRNSILPTFGKQCLDITEMVDMIKMWNRPMFTSIGNQPPSIKKPNNSPYATGGAWFLCEYAPEFIKDLSAWLRQGSVKSIRGTVDWCIDWIVERGFKRFKFVLTAFAMDIAEYFPLLTDPYSHANYGSNAVKTLDLCYDSNGSKNAAFHDAAMDHLCQSVTAQFGTRVKPMDIEDVLCDSQRDWGNYVPKGYEYLRPDQVENRSIVTDFPKHATYNKHLEMWKGRLF